MPFSPSRALPYILVLLAGGVGCKDLTASAALPAGTPDPTTYSTPTGAVGMYTAAVYQFGQAFQQYIVDAGLLSDELEDLTTGATQRAQILNAQAVRDPLDERILPAPAFGQLQGSGTGTNNGVADYSSLQNVRSFVDQAIGALATYDTGAHMQGNPAVLRGKLYALEGYSEIMLADFFCSGVPLSTLDFQHDFTYHAGSTAAQVYQAANAKFDTAITLSAGNDTVLNLARVGKGRALLNLDSAAAAATVVASVPDEFVFADSLHLANNGNNLFNVVATVSDREGGNGLPYISSGDPRTQVVFSGLTNDYGDSLFFPQKLGVPLSGSLLFVPVTVADGIEARLIQAEAAFKAGDPATMIRVLNHLRETARVAGQTTALADTSDPGTDIGRLTLLFRERAFWLFATGHRQGDLRRLLRQYTQYQVFQSDQHVYPTGVYPALGASVYGRDVTVPIPSSEYANPLFHGCLSREP